MGPPAIDVSPLVDFVGGLACFALVAVDAGHVLVFVVVCAAMSFFLVAPLRVLVAGDAVSGQSQLLRACIAAGSGGGQ